MWWLLVKKQNKPEKDSYANTFWYPTSKVTEENR